MTRPNQALLLPSAYPLASAIALRSEECAAANGRQRPLTDKANAPVDAETRFIQTAQGHVSKTAAF